MKREDSGLGCSVTLGSMGRARSRPARRVGCAGLALAFLLNVLPTFSRADPPPDPEAAVSTTRHTLAEATQFMVSAANPLATRVGVGILEKGGNAVDAAIAVQLVLGLVEPQSSGIGGGGFMLVYDQAEQRLTSFDARETAPMAAHYRQFIHQGKALSWPEAVNSGLSVGVPGLLRGLAEMHKTHGRLPWAVLFEPAISMAEQGFEVSPRLHGLLTRSSGLKASASAGAYFYRDGQALPVGYRLINPELGRVYRQVAQHGVDVFYTGEIARAIVDAVGAHDRPGHLSLDDMASYRVVRREAVCTGYRVYTLCGSGPPSSGPIAVMQILGMLAHTPVLDHAPDSAQAVHYFAEAGKLAYADRDVYVADPDFADVPVKALLDPGYLAQRAAAISPERAMKKGLPGSPPGIDPADFGLDESAELPSTTHISVVDAQGNAVSMTTSVESAFGNKMLVRGFLLNNQLTDFSLAGVDAQGRPLLNRVEPGKRPRSAMAPMMVFRDGQVHMLIGAPGGTAIINYVAKTLLGVLGYGLDIQRAIDLPNRGSRNYGTEIEEGTGLTDVVPALMDKGHDVKIRPLPSGLQGIVRTETGWQGGADPRREGLALGR